MRKMRSLWTFNVFKAISFSDLHAMSTLSALVDRLPGIFDWEFWRIQVSFVANWFRDFQDGSAWWPKFAWESFPKLPSFQHHFQIIPNSSGISLHTHESHFPDRLISIAELEPTLWVAHMAIVQNIEQSSERKNALQYCDHQSKTRVEPLMTQQLSQQHPSTFLEPASIMKLSPSFSLIQLFDQLAISAVARWSLFELRKKILWKSEFSICTSSFLLFLYKGLIWRVEITKLKCHFETNSQQRHAEGEAHNDEKREKKHNSPLTKAANIKKFSFGSSTPIFLSQFSDALFLLSERK